MIIGPGVLPPTLRALLGDIAGDVMGTVSDRLVTAFLSSYGRRWLNGEIIRLLVDSRDAERFPGENYVAPQVGLANIGALMQLAAELSIISPELGEVITEGISEDLMVALQHVTTEPIERWFSAIYGAENLDSDDVTEAYAWGLMPPEMMAWLLAVSGVSNSAAAAAMTKALGEKYSGTYRSIQEAASMYGSRTLTLGIDHVDKLYSEARSALFGVPEAARTAYADYVAEVNRAYTQALRKAVEAKAFYQLAQRVETPNAQGQYLAKAGLKLAEAMAWLDVASELESIRDTYIQELDNVLDTVLAGVVDAYGTVRADYMSVLGSMLERIQSVVAGVETALAEEYGVFADALKQIRGVGPVMGSSPAPPPEEVPMVEGTEQVAAYRMCIG